jgi:hypothetical protein
MIARAVVVVVVAVVVALDVLAAAASLSGCNEEASDIARARGTLARASADTLACRDRIGSAARIEVDVNTIAVTAYEPKRGLDAVTDALGGSGREDPPPSSPSSPFRPFACLAPESRTLADQLGALLADGVAHCSAAEGSPDGGVDGDRQALRGTALLDVDPEGHVRLLALHARDLPPTTAMPHPASALEPTNIGCIRARVADGRVIPYARGGASVSMPFTFR